MLTHRPVSVYISGPMSAQVHLRDFPRVPGFGGQPRIVDSRPDREVIQALKPVALQTERLVDRIVIETADPGPACARRLSLEVERLPQHTALPEEVPVKRGAEFLEA